MDHVLITGASGQLGTALVSRLLNDAGTRGIVLLRAGDDARLEQRRVELAARCGIVPERMEAVRGDVSLPHLGMSDADRARVEAKVTSIIHAAASVRFDLAEADAAHANILATGNVLAFARRLQQRGGLARLDHVSTAFIAGTHPGRFHEHDTDVGQSFRNTYEWSKLQSELLVRSAMHDGLPAAIHRPSIVVGERGSGRTRTFNVMYWPLKLYARGWWRTVPGRPDALVDLVPVDWVADTLLRLRARPDTVGGCFHLAAGDGACTIGELAQRVEAITRGAPVRYVNQRIYRVLLRPLIWPFLAITRRGRAILRGGEAYMPYFLRNPRFDTQHLEAMVGTAGAAPRVAEYLERVVRFAIEHDFGDAREHEQSAA